MTNESRPRMMPVHSPILQVKQNLRDAEKRIDELTTAVHQLIAQINTSTTVIDKRFSQDGIVHVDYVTALTDLLNGRNEAQKVLDNTADGANLRDLLNKSMVENVELLRQVVVMQEALYEAQGTLLSANKRVDELTKALINIGDALFKNYILAFAVRDVAPSMDELTRACEIINKALSAHGDETITLRQQLASAQASHHSAMFLLDAVQGDCNEWHDAYVALLKWSQSAYKRLGGLMTIGVSMTPDAVTAKLLEDAPANVAAEVDPFVAELAADLNCTERAVYEYAVDSMGASGIKTVEGCHSAGLHSCYGGLWTCTGCGNRFCDAEGSDNMPELCNDCWFKAQGVAK